MAQPPPPPGGAQPPQAPGGAQPLQQPGAAQPVPQAPVPPPPPPPPQAIAIQPAPPPPVFQAPNNGMTPHFQGLTQNNIVLPGNYDLVKAFQRSIKVFRMSYPEINMANSPQNHQDKYREYVGEMCRLYTQRQPDMTFLNQMNTDIRAEYYQIVISCKRAQGTFTQQTIPNMVCTFQGQQIKRVIDVSTELQAYAPQRMPFTFDDFTILRSSPNYVLTFSIEEQRPPFLALGRGGQQQQPAQQQPFGQFNLIIANTHPEGFEDWIDFGRGVRLLINVYYKARDEQNITSEEVSTFHLRTIELMIRRRLTIFNTTGRYAGRVHQMAAFKKRVYYQRPYIDRQTDSYFWSRPNIGTPFVASNLTQRDATTVRFIDMQIGFETNEDFEDRVCLCNEWCNWNAFFHHNPIYRFLLVRHHQLFMKNMSNIPDMYLCLPVLFGCAPTATIQKPILQLMYCANEYRKRYYHSFYLKSRNRRRFQQLYANSHPLARVMDGLTYNKLRNELDITQLCHIFNRNPFADICIENLIHYYNVMTDLHLHMSSDQNYVTDRRLWSSDMDILGRHKFGEYVKQSYDKCISQLIVGYDSLFTDDYEYTTQLPKTEALQEIRDHRNRVRRSPFNVSANTSVFLNTFASVYKFLSRVEPILPGVYKQDARVQVALTYKQMDVDFDGFRNANINLDFELDSTRSGFNNLQQNFDAFYTLKLYFYAFEIQKHCINAFLKYMRKIRAKLTQVSSSYDFIWNYEFIEQNYRNTYNGEVLFHIEDFEPLFTDFYDTFWGRAQHETQPLQYFTDYFNSGYFQYQRLYYWERNNGNNRLKFARIIQSLNTCLTNIRQMSDLILDQIETAVAFLTFTPGFPLTQDIANRPPYPHSVEVYDHLCYYLVKANCSIILSTVAKFFRPMHALQFDHLIRNHTSYTLCKPGWIPLFRTMADVFTALDDLKTRNIVYDDEFERISNTCFQTKRMIKGIYRQFYAKLVHEWDCELGRCFARIGQMTQNVFDFIQFHLAYGLAFCAFFADNYRYEFATIRKQMFKRLNIPPVPHLQHQTTFVGCLPIVRHYLRNRQLIALARPMTGPPWRQHMLQTIQRFNQLNGQQLNIDLNAADV